MSTQSIPMTTAASANCATCPVYNHAQLKKLGVNTDGARFVVALAGNPNTGKSTVFNALTGLRQHVGNWTGKTVARAEGGFVYGSETYKIVDLPGTYSLLSTSTDEEIARDFILFAQPSVTVVVVDATRLERNLNLALQIMEITDRVVIALNLMDEAERHGLAIDVRHLARSLGVPVVPMAARQRQGINELLAAIAQVARGEVAPQPRRITALAPQVERAVQELTADIEAEFPGLANARWVAMRLLDGDPTITEAVQNRTLGDLARGSVVAPVGDVVPLERVS